jgi:hypothetical protein
MLEVTGGDFWKPYGGTERHRDNNEQYGAIHIRPAAAVERGETALGCRLTGRDVTGQPAHENWCTHAQGCP